MTLRAVTLAGPAAGPLYTLNRAMKRILAAGFVMMLGLACGDAGTGPPSLHSIELRLPASATSFMANDTIQLLVVGRDQSGAPYPAEPVTWRSSNPAVIHVDSVGHAAGLSTGAATIVATVGTLGDSVSLAVTGTRHRLPITSNATWTLAGAPHAVTGVLTVGGPAGATLTIEPGVTVLFDGSASLTFGVGGFGALQAQGSPAAPITMRSIDTAAMNGAWVGLGFRGGSASELHHVTVRDCGRYPLNGLPAACILVGDGLGGPAPTLLVDHVTVQHGSAAGVVLQGGARFAGASSMLSVHDMRGNIGIVPAGAAAGFPTGGTFAAIDVNRVYVVGDSLRESATWSASIPWGVVNPVIIEGPNQPVLTIPAGTTMRMQGGFVVGRNAPGGLSIGTEGGPTVTLRPETTDWGGIDFGPFAVSSAINDAVLDGCGKSDFTRYGTGCVYIFGSLTPGGPAPTPLFKNVTIRNAQDFGVALGYRGAFAAGSANLTITGTTGSGFATGRPMIFGQSSPGSIPPGQYTGNLIDEIWINQLDLTASDTWHDRGVPYLVYGIISVGSDANPTLTIDSAATVIFSGGTRVLVGMDQPGAFRAIGTAAAPVTLNSQNPVPGGWVGIVFGPYADASSALDHAIVDNAGAADPWIAGAIHFYVDLGDIIHNTVISHSSSCGVIIVNQPPWSTDFTAPALGNTFVNNAGAAQCGP